MPKYNVQMPYLCTVTIIVEADTEEEAKIEAAGQEPYLCYSCSKKVLIDAYNEDAPYDMTTAELIEQH